MKKIYFLLGLIFSANAIFAQITENQLAKADSLFEIEKFQEASKIYKKIPHTTDNLEVMHRLSLCYMNLNKVEKAKDILRKINVLDSTFDKSYADYSNLLLIEGQTDSALFYIKKAQKHNPDTLIYRTFEAINYLYQEKLEPAFSILEEVLEIDPNNETANYYMAHIYFMTNTLDSALRYVNLALKEKETGSSYKLKTEIYFAQERYSDAIFEIDKAIKLEPENDDYIVSKIEIFMKIEQYQDVIRLCLPKVSEKYITEYYYYLILGYMNSMKSGDSALYYIKKAQKEDPNNDIFYYLEGYIYYYTYFDYDNAYLCFSAALTLNPKKINYYYYVANSKIYKNTQETVFKDVRERFELLNQEYFKDMKKWSKSKKHKYYYFRLLSKFKNDPTTLGFDEYFMLYFGNALQNDFTPYLVNNPAIREAYENKNYEKCIKLGTDFVKEHPTNLLSYYFISNSYYMLDNLEMATKYLTIYLGFVKGIIFSGSGLNKDEPYIVSSVNDEYTILEFFEYSATQSSLINGKKHNYDVFSYKHNNQMREMYFNIDLFYGKKNVIRKNKKL